jgi:hypothetical protein
MIVQPRDRMFLGELSTMRVIDHEQAKLVAGFGSTSRANKRLLKLTRAGLLRRFFLGSGGGRKALYSLSAKGALVAQAPLHGLRRRQGAMLVADAYVEHQLAVNAIYCAVKFGTIPLAGVLFHRWIAFSGPIAPELPLIPDGYVEFSTASGPTAMFLEMDLGNESLAIWREKTRQYLALATSGAYRRIFNRERFRVLVVLNSARRLESVRKTVAAMTDKVFRLSTVADARSSFFGPVWQKPAGGTPETLFEQPR